MWGGKLTRRMNGRSPSKKNVETFLQDVQFASDQELAWLLRWALSRLTRVREGGRELCHGCLDWDMYEEWRGRERSEFYLLSKANRTVAKYPFDAFTAFSTILPADVFHFIVNPLFDLLSRFAAHSHKSGLTPHAISSYFAPLLFDIPANVPCLNAHAAFVRAASASEHMLLAYIRSSGGSDNLGLTDLPFRLQEWVNGYPSMVASDADLARGLPRRAARVVRCEVATRTVRAYARDLVLNSESWIDDMPRGWQTWDRVVDKTRRGEASRPKFTPAWRRRLVVKETLPLPASSNQKQQIAYGAPLSGAQNGNKRGDADEGDEGRYASLAGKEWSMFEEGGFDAPRTSFTTRNNNTNEKGDIQSRLQFDLNEGAKKSVAEKRQTMDWSDFVGPSGGFSRTEPFLTASLTFSAPVQSQITEWPKERDELRRRLHKTQKESTPFNHDTTPRTGPTASLDGADSKGRVYIEEAFVDCWADFMLGSGWTDRDELTFKEASWALIEYKARPNHPDAQEPDQSLDPRTSELYFLFEERVPLDYQMAVADPKRKKTLNTFFSKKKNKQQDFDPRVMRQTDFDKMLNRSVQPKKLTITRADQSVSSSLWHAMTDSKKGSTNGTMPTTPMASSRTLKAAPAKNSPATLTPSPRANLSPVNVRSPDDAAKLGNGRPGIFKKSIRRQKSGEEHRAKAKQQREVSMDFEIQTASGASSGNNSPQNSKDEKWMDILIANGARPMDISPKAQAAQAQAEARRVSPPALAIKELSKPTTRRKSPPSDDLTPSATQLSSLNLASSDTHSTLQPPLQLDSTDYGDGFELGSNDIYERDRETYRHSSHSSYDRDSQPGSVHTTEDGSVQPSDSISMRRRPISPPPDSPTPVEEILASPRASALSDHEGIVAPKPRIAGSRDAIFSIVDNYRDSRHTDHTQFSELSEAYDGVERDSTYASERGTTYDPRESVIERTYASERINSAYSLEDEFVPPPIFDLTPGREPSPARYKHGEPLHFGE